MVNNFGEYTRDRKGESAMMDQNSYQSMMGGDASFFMWLTYFLLTVVLILSALALTKYILKK